MMRLLLDTCILYDWMMDTLVDRAAIELIQRTGALVSAASVWEMAIKNGLGKLPLPTHHIVDAIQDQGFGFLNITPVHAQAVLALAYHHKDPFDRLLIAQAQCEGLRIVTYDRLIGLYLPDTMLVRPG